MNLINNKITQIKIVKKYKILQIPNLYKFQITKKWTYI